MRKTSQSYLLIMSSCFAVSCGGGGGTIIQPAQPVAITSANAPAISGLVVDGILAMRSLDDAGFGIVAGIATALGSDGRIAALGSGRVMRHAVASRAVTLATAADTENCMVSGSVTFTGHVADPQTITTGDSASVIFHNCNDGDGFIVNGSLDITFTSFAGTLDGIESLSFNADFGQFLVSSDGDSALIDGQARIDVDGSLRPVYAVTASGTTIAATVNNVRSTLTNFEITTSYDSTAASSVANLINGSGTLTSASIGGLVDFAIVESLAHVEGAAFPQGGQVEMIGADNSRVVLTGIDDVNVILDVDADGDSVPEDSIETTWAALHD